MAPEMLRDGTKVRLSAKTDVYALGVMLHEARLGDAYDAVSARKRRSSTLQPRLFVVDPVGVARCCVWCE